MESDIVESVVRHNILARRSIRGGFADRPVTEADMLDLVEAGIHAPSGSNTQSVRFVIINTPNEISRIGKIRGNAIAGARGLIAVFVDRAVVDWSIRHNGELWKKLAYQDSAAAIQNMLLLATAKGIGSCWISAYEEMNGTDCLAGKNWADVFEVPDLYEIMGLVMLGYLSKHGPGDTAHRGRPVKRKGPYHYISGAICD